MFISVLNYIWCQSKGESFSPLIPLDQLIVCCVEIMLLHSHTMNTIFKANISYQRKAWDFFDQIVVCGGKLSGLYPHQISSYFSQGNKIQTAWGQYGPNLGELICNYLDILQPQLLSQSYVSYECWCEECRHHYLEHDVSKLHRRECLGKDDGKSRDCSSLKTFQRAVLFHQL